MENLISERAKVVENWEDFAMKYLRVCNDDPYDENNNPMGYVNLGIADNCLCWDLIHPRLISSEMWTCDPDLLQYKDSFGIERIRKIFAKLITEFFESHEPVSADNLIFLAGVCSCIDLLAHCLADPGDVFLVPTPMYSRIYTDFKQRSRIEVWPIPILCENSHEEFPELTVEKVMLAYENAIAANQVVRGILLINPSNPLGDIYSKEFLMDVLVFCKVKRLHVILDELYALSVFSKTQKFHSVLKFPRLPDPQRTHVIYGLSKDFAMAGLRVGLVHTKCDSLKRCLIQLSKYSNIPFPVMEIVAKYFEDIEWCRQYVNENQKRLAERYEFCKNYLKKLGLQVRESSAGFFLWVDFRHICGSSFDHEREFFEYLLQKAHLFIGPGQEYFCGEPGWFRIIFTGSLQYVTVGLNRFQKALEAYKVFVS